jgi:hypothetical protein
MTLFEFGEPDKKLLPHSETSAKRAMGAAYLLGVVAIAACIIYVMGFLMGD